MHYFQFNIGDYRASTAHLSNEEDLAYRRLLDMYYDTENKIPLDTEWVARRIRVDEKTLIAVLKDMFVKEDDGWSHPRCDEAIRQYQAMAEKNRANGRLGGRKKNPVGSQVATDSLPIAKATNNYKPITNTNTTPQKRLDCPPEVNQTIWLDFVAHRKHKRAAITETALTMIAKEAKKAGWPLEKALVECINRGWTGFKAEWVTNQLDKPRPNLFAGGI